jgi:hypothetical protein
MILIIVFKNKHNYYTASISIHPPHTPVKNYVWALSFYFSSVITTLSPWCVQDRTCYEQHLQDLDHQGIAM